MRKVLIITYYWPPGSGAGVQRWLKFSKYLTQYRWEPVILTIDPQYATYPAIDRSLASEIPPSLKVHRTKAFDYFRFYSRDKSQIPSSGFADDKKENLFGQLSKFIRGNFFIPDPRRGWNRFAFSKACEIILDGKIRHVITTSPPHSTQLIGLKLKKKFPELLWVADLRDPWTDIYYYSRFYHTAVSRRIDLNYEKQVLKSADRIITVGHSLMSLFESRVPGISTKSAVISNGYDMGDFAGLVQTKPEKFTISYIGTLSTSYPLEGFLRALKIFREQKTDLVLRFIGKVSEEQKELIHSNTGKTKADLIEYVNHHTSIRYMLDSSVLLLIIPDHRTNNAIITGKLFEYLAAGKPVICLGPANGDAANILTSTGRGRTFDYNDEQGIADYLKLIASNTDLPIPDPPPEYSRENLVKKVVALLNQSV